MKNAYILSTPRSGSSLLFSGVLANIQNIIPITPINDRKTFIIGKDYTLHKVHTTKDIIKDTTQPKIFFIKRRNKIKQAISLIISRKLDIWNFTLKNKNISDKELSNKLNSLNTIDILNEIPKVIKCNENNNKKFLLHLLKYNQLSFTTLFYEDLVENYTEIIRNSIKFLYDIIPNINPVPITIKWGTEYKKFIYQTYVNSNLDKEEK